MTTQLEFIELLKSRGKQTPKWVGIALSVDSQKLHSFGYAGMGQIMYRELRDGSEVKLWVTALIDEGRLVPSSESRYVPELDQTMLSFDWVDYQH